MPRDCRVANFSMLEKMSPCVPSNVLWVGAGMYEVLLWFFGAGAGVGMGAIGATPLMIATGSRFKST